MIRIGLFLLSIGIAHANEVPQRVVSACMNDALRHCAVEAVSGDHAKTGVCMRKHSHLLSEACRTALREWSK